MWLKSDIMCPLVANLRHYITMLINSWSDYLNLQLIMKNGYSPKVTWLFSGCNLQHMVNFKVLKTYFCKDCHRNILFFNLFDVSVSNSSCQSSKTAAATSFVRFEINTVAEEGTRTFLSSRAHTTKTVAVCSFPCTADKIMRHFSNSGGFCLTSVLNNHLLSHLLHFCIWIGWTVKTLKWFDGSVFLNFNKLSLS